MIQASDKTKTIFFLKLFLATLKNKMEENFNMPYSFCFLLLVYVFACKTKVHDFI